MPVPRVFRFVNDLQRVLQILQNAQVVDGMDLARDLKRDRTNKRAIQWRARQQRWLGMRLVQIFDDRKRLREYVVTVDKRRHDAVRIQLAIIRLQLLPAIAQKMDRGVLKREPFEIQRDAHAIRRRATKIAV